MDDDTSFTGQAHKGRRGFFSEFLHFAAHNKKWWLVPILLVLLLLGILVLAGGTGAAPFIYSLF